ncbi:hypothetical protein SLEP1_g34163 [Rubroshorea leprosula]|uniref:Uncharacterized protein n=1 Tax=Rubroshorea leprosula TaxID=152421 RepID=A0AAV5KIZ3_9ROSI|nr:hypothetical protein SLEP1_g34163 [Rubroshorea leprosula]
MAPMRKKNCSGRSQLRHRRVRFPMSSSFCFRKGLFLPRLLPLPVSDFHRRAETMAPIRKKNCSGKSQLRRHRVRFPISSSFCFRQGLFRPRLLPLPVSETQLRRLQKMKKWVSKQRAELSREKESVEKNKGLAEERANTLAEQRRLIELGKKEDVLAERTRLIELHNNEDAFGKRCIDLTLKLSDAEEQGDFTRAELLKRSLSELLAEMDVGLQAFIS